MPPKVENRHRDLGKGKKKTHSLSQGGAGKQDHERKKMMLSERKREKTPARTEGCEKTEQKR